VKIKLTHVLVSAGIILAGLTGAVINELQQPADPHCPTEDSCWVDYDGATDRWVIHEGQVNR
jgi:hypothetical protein